MGQLYTSRGTHHSLNGTTVHIKRYMSLFEWDKWLLSGV